MAKTIFEVEFPLPLETKMQILMDEKRDLSAIVSTYLAWNPEVYLKFLEDLKDRQTPSEKEETALETMIKLMEQQSGSSLSLSQRENLRQIIIMTFNYRIGDKEIYRHHILNDEELMANAYEHEVKTIRFTFSDYYNAIINKEIRQLEKEIAATGWLVKVHSQGNVKKVDLFKDADFIPLNAIMDGIIEPQKEGAPKLKVSLTLEKGRLVLRRGQNPDDDIYELIALDENKNPMKINL